MHFRVHWASTLERETSSRDNCPDAWSRYLISVATQETNAKSDFHNHARDMSCTARPRSSLARWPAAVVKMSYYIDNSRVTASLYRPPFS